MSSIKDLTYQQLKEHKRFFELGFDYAMDDFTRKTFGLAIEGIQAEMDRRNRKTILSMVVTVNILVLISILVCGCQTAKGMMEDGAWLLNTGADNITTQEK